MMVMAPRPTPAGRRWRAASPRIHPTPAAAPRAIVPDAGEQRILPQVFADAAHVGVEIPHAAHAGTGCLAAHPAADPAP